MLDLMSLDLILIVVFDVNEELRNWILGMLGIVFIEIMNELRIWEIKINIVCYSDYIVLIVDIFWY